jgi:hypothetical protein
VLIEADDFRFFRETKCKADPGSTAALAYAGFAKVTALVISARVSKPSSQEWLRHAIFPKSRS